MQYYECHITLEHEPQGHRTLQSVIEEMCWKFSAIDGDPVLGRGTKCYATKHYPARMDQEVIKWKVQDAADELRQKGFQVVREKVELVLWDSKQGMLDPARVT